MSTHGHTPEKQTVASTLSLHAPVDTSDGHAVLSAANALVSLASCHHPGTPSYSSGSHLVDFPPSLQHHMPSFGTHRPMDYVKAPSVCSQASRHSSASSTKSNIARRLAEQETRKKFLQLKRAAEEERARAREIMIESNLQDKIVELETERLKNELHIIEEAELVDGQGVDLPGPIKMVPDRTTAWVDDSINLPQKTPGVICSETVCDNNIGNSPILPQSSELVSMSFSGSGQQLHSSVTSSMILGKVQNGIDTGSHENHNAALLKLQPAGYTFASQPAFAQLPMHMRSFATVADNTVVTTATVNSQPTVLNPQSQSFTPTGTCPSTSVSVPNKDGEKPTEGEKPPESHKYSQHDMSENRLDESDVGDSSDEGDSSDDDSDDSCRPTKGKGKKIKTSSKPNVNQAPVVINNVPFNYGYGMLRDSLPKLDIPKFDNEYDVKQYVTFRSLWDSVMEKPEYQLPPATKFAYLRSHLGGRPLSMADRNLVLGDEAYSTTMKQFTKAFGDPALIVQGLIHQLASRSALSYADWAGLQDFSDELVTMVQTAKKLGYKAELKHHQYAIELTSKLPERLHTEFLTKMWQQDRGTKYTVIHLSRWLKGKTGPAGLILLEKANRAKAVKDSIILKDRNHDRKTFSRKPPAVKAYVANTGSTESAKEHSVTTPSTGKESSANRSQNWAAKKITCLYFNISEFGHFLETCDKFLKLTVDQKLKWLKENNRCNKCGKRHSKECQFPKKCQKCDSDHRTRFT